MSLRDISKLLKFMRDLEESTHAFKIHANAIRVPRIIPSKKFTEKSWGMPNQKIIQSRPREGSQTKQEFIKKHPNSKFLIHNL